MFSPMNKQNHESHEQNNFIIMISELLKLSFLKSRLIIFVKKLEDAFNIKETPKCDEKWKNQMPTTHHIQYQPQKRKRLEIYLIKIIGLSKSTVSTFTEGTRIAFDRNWILKNSSEDHFHCNFKCNCKYVDNPFSTTSSMTKWVDNSLFSS